MLRLVLEYKIFDLTRSVGSQCIRVVKNAFLKIQLGKNSFEMLQLSCGGDKDADNPSASNLRNVKITSLTCV